MKAKEEFEFIVALIQEYTNTMPQATKFAVMKHAQDCVNVVYGVLEQYDNLQNTKETAPAPTVLTEETSTSE
jgi:hypothetical protein